VTANAFKTLAATVLAIAAVPSMLTMFDLSPMGYHAGFALTGRVVLLLLATLLWASVVAYAGALYWVNVVRPAPAPVRLRRR
jgi:hypothetical protein